ncbi:MAG: GGDEF domain-containing protein [Gemmatimonadetes bacterium]|nr:GGDEF domain-containing protein [Gemmatimonadota bacterium]
MFFRRSSPAPAPVAAPDPSVPTASGADVISPVLDAFGQLMAAFTNGVFDMPDHPEGEVRGHLDAWRRHAMIGAAAPTEHTDDAPPRSGLPLEERDWSRTTNAFSEHRRAEKLFVETALADLREALWLCVERTHEALEAEQEAGTQSAVQMDRLRQALTRLETGVVKTEITVAMRSLEQITEQRQHTQRAIYGQLAERIEELGSQLDEARKASETDALTALGNRLCFDRAAARQVHLHALNGNPLVVILLDLDRLKPLNDTHGHQAGDLALQALAKCLHRVFLREADIVCRIGGDEFAVVLPNTSVSLAQKLIERLDATIAAEPWPFAEQGLPLSASIGFAAWQRGESIEQWIARADAALYADKQSRREKPAAA